MHQRISTKAVLNIHLQKPFLIVLKHIKTVTQTNHKMFFRTLENKLFIHSYIMLSFSEATYDACDYNVSSCSTNSFCITTTFQV